ncbi:MAG: YeeE/YedE family protein [Vibrio hibernica]
MQIPWFSLGGGMLLGVSATLLLLFNGKVAGISGIVSGMFIRQQSSKLWRFLFVIGLIVGGFIANFWSSKFNPFLGIPQQYDTGLLMMVLSGILVGVGTKLGNGCTSGHGICGMGRFSLRSVVATFVFMIIAAITVFIRLHIVEG